MAPSSTVFLLDDDQSFSGHLWALTTSMGLQCRRFTSCEDVLLACRSETPACVVMELINPEEVSLQLLADLARQPGLPSVIVLTDRADVVSVVRAAHHGVAAYIQKQHASDSEILEAVQAAVRDHGHRRLERQRHTEIQTRFESLTPREQAVLQMLLQGLELTGISEQLQVSRRTVENHRAKLMEKLQVANFPALVALATEYDGLSAKRPPV